MAEFKIGDKVKIIRNSYFSGLMDKYIGYVGYITHLNGCCYNVDNVCVLTGPLANWFESELELVTKEEDKVEPKLAIGTKVKIVGQQYLEMGCVGKTGVITGNDYPSVNNRYYETDATGEYVFSREELEVLSGFSKSDLRNGMLCQTRKGEWYMVMIGVNNFSNTEDVLINVASYGFLELDGNAEDLKDINEETEFDIVKVATVNSPINIFSALRKGKTIESCDSFKVIYDIEQEKAKQEAEQRVKELKEQLEVEQKKLKELSA